MKWYESVEGEPGITTETLAALRIKADEYRARGIPLLGCLMMDEMAIRQQVEWNHHQKHMDGSINHGSMVEGKESDLQDHITPAKEALVFMVTGIQEQWKVPVAYFLSSGLTASEKANIVQMMLQALSEAGVQIVALTFDGTSTNIAMANNLGCNLKPDDPSFSTSFRHPCEDRNVYVLLDACHMLKLVRNTFASQGTLTTDTGEVRWDFVEMLHNKQKLHGQKLAPKLTEKHVKFENTKMRVNLAAQVLSNSVAEALQTLKALDDSFAGADATIEFISFFNDLFDYFNSMSVDDEGMKRPLGKDNFHDEIFEAAENYIRSIRNAAGVSILRTQQKTGYLGFIILMRSFRALFKEFVATPTDDECGNVLTHLFTYRFSQDHLESFFGAIRAKGGCNNNPNSVQFRACYKRMIHNNDITASAKANCKEFDQTKLLLGRQEQATTSSSKNTSRALETDVAFEDTKNRLMEAVSPSVFSTDDFLDECVSRDALDVQHRLLQKLNFKHSITDLLMEEVVDGSSVCGSVTIICKVADLAFTGLVNGKTNFNVGKYYALLANTIFLRLQNEQTPILPGLPNQIDENCKERPRESIMKLIIGVYLDIRSKRYSKSIIPPKEYKRNVSNKVILFLGQ